MKETAVKEQFVALRADGLSLSKVAAKLKIGKATASTWDRELSEQVTGEKRKRLDALSEQYAMARCARVKRLGMTLEKIEEAIGAADFLSIPPEKLLDLKLKYLQALKEEGRLDGSTALPSSGDVKPEEVYSILLSVIERTRKGDISEAQARQEINAALALVKAREAIETNRKLDELERLVNERGE